MELDVDVIVDVCRRDESIARVLREVCSLDGVVRGCALDLVEAHLAGRVAPHVLEGIAALRGDELARQIAARIGPPA